MHSCGVYICVCFFFNGERPCQGFENFQRVLIDFVQWQALQTDLSGGQDYKIGVAHIPHRVFNCVHFCTPRKEHSWRCRNWRLHSKWWKWLLYLQKRFQKHLPTHNPQQLSQRCHPLPSWQWHIFYLLCSIPDHHHDNPHSHPNSYRLRLILKQ